MIFALLAGAWPAAAADYARGARPFEDCLGAALTRQPGRVVKVEFKETEAGRRVYEFDIQGADARSWDLECDADTGGIIGVEREVDTAADARFAAQAKVTEAEARATVAAAYPGEIEEIEYEIEEDGGATYEFDVAGVDGEQTKVEVNAATGEVIEVDRERWQVGFE
jgi:uncharacterized membrane protein YkoI